MSKHTRVTAALSFAALMVGALLAQRAPAATEWRYYGGDPASTRYSPLDQVSKANVTSLRVAWRWTSPDNEIAKANPTARPGAYQDTPLMSTECSTPRRPSDCSSRLTR